MADCPERAKANTGTLHCTHCQHGSHLVEACRKLWREQQQALGVVFPPPREFYKRDRGGGRGPATGRYGGGERQATGRYGGGGRPAKDSGPTVAALQSTKRALELELENAHLRAQIAATKVSTCARKVPHASHTSVSSPVTVNPEAHPARKVDKAHKVSTCAMHGQHASHATVPSPAVVKPGAPPDRQDFQ